MQIRSVGQEDSLEEEMAIHSIILAWKIPWTEEPGGLESMLSNKRSHCNKKPANCNYRKARSAMKTQHSHKYVNIYIYIYDIQYS